MDWENDLWKLIAAGIRYKLDNNIELSEMQQLLYDEYLRQSEEDEWTF